MSTNARRYYRTARWRTYFRERQTLERAKRASHGLCTRCGKEPAVPGKLACAACRLVESIKSLYRYRQRSLLRAALRVLQPQK